MQCETNKINAPVIHLRHKPKSRFCDETTTWQWQFRRMSDNRHVVTFKPDVMILRPTAKGTKVFNFRKKLIDAVGAKYDFSNVVFSDSQI